jgi:hypothetical protein
MTEGVPVSRPRVISLSGGIAKGVDDFLPHRFSLIDSPSSISEYEA